MDHDQTKRQVQSYLKQAIDLAAHGQELRGDDAFELAASDLKLAVKTLAEAGIVPQSNHETYLPGDGDAGWHQCSLALYNVWGGLRNLGLFKLANLINEVRGSIMHCFDFNT